MILFESVLDAVILLAILAQTNAFFGTDYDFCTSTHVLALPFLIISTPIKLLLPLTFVLRILLQCILSARAAIAVLGAEVFEALGALEAEVVFFIAIFKGTVVAYLRIVHRINLILYK